MKDLVSPGSKGDGFEVTKEEVEPPNFVPENVDDSMNNDREGGGGPPRPNFSLESDDTEEFERGLHLARYYKDHFTLPAPSSTVRFRSKQNCAKVFEFKSTQFVLEETYDPGSKKREITAKQMDDSTTGLQVLRGIYTLVCSLWTVFFFIFCLQVILFLVLDLAIESGATAINADLNVGKTIGVILAIFVLVYGFASALVIAGHYIYDSWTGHYLTKQFVFWKLSDVVVEWIFFSILLLIPLLVMCLALLTKSENWWTITSLTWFGCVLLFFLVFAASTVFYEVSAAFDFVRSRCDPENNSFLEVLKKSILLRQTHGYSGKRLIRYLARSDFETTEATEDYTSANIFENTRVESLDLWSKFTMKCATLTDPNASDGRYFFKPLDPPVRLFTLSDALDYRPFVTRNTWSLERVFCRPSNSRYIAIVKGPSAMTRAQIRSSLACSGLGTALVLLVIVSGFVWIGLPWGFVAFIFIASLIFAGSSLQGAFQLIKVSKDLILLKTEMAVEDAATSALRVQRDSSHIENRGLEEGYAERDYGHDVGENTCEGIFLVSKYIRVTEASENLCWVMFFLEVVFFFIWPMSTLFSIGNGSLGGIFVAVSAVTAVRHYVNVVVAIEECGNLGIGFVRGKSASDRWIGQSRLSELVGAISGAKSRKIWAAVLGGFSLIIVGLFFGAVGQDTDASDPKQYTYLNDFYYPPMDSDMRYPTCILSNANNKIEENATLTEFAFLAGLAYRSADIRQIELDRYFTNRKAIDDIDTVEAFRNKSKAIKDAAVDFKLIRFPNERAAIISIRGTSTNWDLLADSQLWSAAFLLQGSRLILPFGNIWTPILDELVWLINKLQSSSLKRVSFYTVTTEFAEKMRDDPEIDTLQITGHSLGGGLSIISGAQAGVPAVALSGPNAMIAGRSFGPNVTAERLNRYTFNIVPNRDIVPQLDIVADQFQNIRCTAPANEFYDCHTARRSFCEIMYTCGSGNHPAVCECVRDFHYPEPTRRTGGNRTFAEACPLLSS